MKFSTALAAVAVGAASVAALPSGILVDETDPEIPWYTGLSRLQSKYAGIIMAQAKKERLGAQGCQAGIATALMESTLIMHANKAVPESLTYQYDRLGYDGDSVGLFQQRASIYTDVGCGMSAACSAHQFFSDMRGVPDWQSLDVGTLCQSIQRSQNPERYHKFTDEAAVICEEGGFDIFDPWPPSGEQSNRHV